MINTDTIKTDINLEMAQRAYDRISFRSEKRGADAVASYVETMEELAKFIEDNAKDVRQQEIAQEVFDDLRRKYKSKKLAHLNAISNCISSMIVGPSSFPVRRAEKANVTEHKRSVELLKFHNNLEKYALKNLDRVIPKPEKTLSELDQQKQKLKSLEDNQELMKRINAQYRKGGWDTVDGISDDMKRELKAAMERDWRKNPKPFESYQLTNNNANIKRVRQRVKELEAKATATKEHGSLDQQLNGLTICRNFEEDRLQLLFDEKPDEKTRGLLKSHGFRWSPRFSAWQRKLTNNALYVLKNILLKDEIMQKYLEADEWKNKRHITVYFEDGNTIDTEINGSKKRILEHYIGEYFNFGDTDEHPKDKMVKAVRVVFHDDEKEPEPEEPEQENKADTQNKTAYKPQTFTPKF